MSTSTGAALITGGAHRIGAAIALALGKRGLDIALHYLSSHDAAAAVAHEIKGMGRQCHLLRCDLSNEQEVATLIDRVDRLLPELNLLVNNASVFEPTRLFDTGPTCFNRHFNVNLKAPIFLARDFATGGRTGHIINMLDTRIAKSDGSDIAYTLSKKALFEFTKMAAKELGPAIRVNGVSPGLILAPRGQGQDYLREKSTRIPLQRVGDTENLISAILFLMDNPFVTGECLFIDGGEHL